MLIPGSPSIRTPTRDRTLSTGITRTLLYPALAHVGCPCSIRPFTIFNVDITRIDPSLDIYRKPILSPA
jgi:hypothetical protein